ncbi:3-dehydroquinate synthase [Aquisphaera giovannonii]|uniref:3-dehydroquinate synthase n=1 Tax=Aquisphaera giovannonii TaxID=406548 RepID=A0A5B9W1R4_9BACT|nr:3-dehydroquinate synthase [Aquisphaera giovannonii]QEH33920.1 3-dehydroquinate synthase [Aquisphaera giovannonii]
MPEPPDGTESSVLVDLGPRRYTVRVVTGSRGFGAFARESLAATWAGRACRSALVVTDANLADHPAAAGTLDALRNVQIEPRLAVLDPGEATKSLPSASRLYDELVAMRADRHAAVVAVGGGVIGDLAGFAAATYARGVPLLMVPTTLLAQVDSSVGGKVGINHPRAKNIIGAFHQPSGVWVDTATLDTLPDRELRCGLAEVVKYGVILDAAFFEGLEERVGEILARDPAAIRWIVARCCELKADVVTRDEREETGLRAVLNFGHTVGHAVEAVAGYGGAYQHGEAVAAGMVAECRIAERIGWIGPGLTDRLIGLLARIGLPTRINGCDPATLLEAMGRDKKNEAGAVRFVLPRELGRVELTGLPSRDDVVAALEPLCR